MPKISHERWKVWGNVFDGFTEQLLLKLISQGHFEGIQSPISIGKEANIFSAIKKDGTKIIVKIYRLESCNFNKMYDYIKQDVRYINLKKQRREVVFTWAQREYRNLRKAREIGIRVPTVYTIAKHIIIMEYIGDDQPAQQAKNDLPNTNEKRKQFFETCIQYMHDLWYKAKLVHGDLSGYNILSYHDKPVFIDFSQGTSTESGDAIELLKRDVKNVVAFAKKVGVSYREEDVLEKVLKNG